MNQIDQLKLAAIQHAQEIVREHEILPDRVREQIHADGQSFSLLSATLILREARDHFNSTLDQAEAAINALDRAARLRQMAATSAEPDHTPPNLHLTEDQEDA